MRLSNTISVMLIGGVLFLAFLARENSLAFQQCVSLQETKPDQANVEKFPGIVINSIARALAVRCTGRLINKMNAVITALATLTISTFTVVLVFVTNRQAKFTADSVALAKDALLKTERAFVFIDGFNFELTTLADGPRDTDAEKHLTDRVKSDPGLYITYFAVQPRWKNGGTTPTDDLDIRIDWRAPGSPLPVDFSYRANPRPFFLGPQAVETSEYIQMQGAQAIVDWQWNPIPPSPQMFIWGRADYWDVFGEKHFTEWCYELRFSRPIRSERLRAEFIQWGEYNRTDKSS